MVSSSAETEADIKTIAEALAGTNVDQARIAVTGLAWIALLLKKNKDYGTSVWKRPKLAPTLDAGSAILVRMTDKIERIEQLQKSGQAAVKTESLEDTIIDLGSYCLLYISRPK